MDSTLTYQGFWGTAPTEDIGSLIDERVDRFYDAINQNGMLNLWQNAHDAYYAGGLSGGQLEVQAQGGAVKLKIPEVHAVGNRIASIVTSQRLAFHARAKNTDSKSLQQAKLATSILEDLHKRDLGAKSRDCVEAGWRYGESALHMFWDPDAGEEYGVDPETGEITHTGALSFEIVSPTDLIRDVARRNARADDYLMVRKMVNKYDLAAQYPEFEDDILGAPAVDPGDSRQPSLGSLDSYAYEEYEDFVYVVHVFIRPTPAMVRAGHIDGRTVIVLRGTGVVLEDSDLAYGFIPVFRLVAAEWAGRNQGYSAIFDTLSAQSAHDAVFSVICSNQSTAGQVIVSPKGAGTKLKHFGNGTMILEVDGNSTVQPQALNLTATHETSYRTLDKLEEKIQGLAGLSEVSLGEAPGAKMAGNAMALLAAQSIESQSPLQKAYVEFCEKVADAAIRIFRQEATVEQTVSIVGTSNRTYTKNFIGPRDLVAVQGIRVEVINALGNTLSGRIAMASEMLQFGLISDPRDYVTVHETGALPVLYENEESQANLIREENEAFREGPDAFAKILAIENYGVLMSDDHKRHIPEHLGILADLEARANAELVKAVLAHVQAHEDMMTALMPPAPMDPNGMPAANGPMPEGGAPPPPPPADGAPEGLPEPAKNPLDGQPVVATPDTQPPPAAVA